MAVVLESACKSGIKKRATKRVRVSVLKKLTVEQRSTEKQRAYEIQVPRSIPKERAQVFIIVSSSSGSVKISGKGFPTALHRN